MSDFVTAVFRTFCYGRGTMRSVLPDSSLALPSLLEKKITAKRQLASSQLRISYS